MFGQRANVNRLIWLVVDAVLIWLAIGQWSRMNLWALLFWGVAPDLFGLLPAALMGRAPGKGMLPPRGVPLYNAWHTFWTPVLVGLVAWALRGSLPIEMMIGWGIHIATDRVVGYGLRAGDGSIRPVTLVA